MYDYHVHSSFSADCWVEMETMIKAAVSVGLRELCFTEHVDLDYMGDSSIPFELDIPAYFRKFEGLKQKYESQIILKKGLELGLQPHILDDCLALVNNNFDFVIASLHTCAKKDIHNGDLFKMAQPLEVYRQYYEELSFCTSNFQAFNVIGHLDLLKRYSHHAPPQKAELFLDILETLFKDLIPRGKGIEVNTSGLRTPPNETLPSLEVLKLYKSLGGEIITLGSDSHFPEHLGHKFPETSQQLKSIGFKYFTSFTAQKPEFIKIP